MPVYVLMTKLAPGNMHDAASRKGKGKDSGGGLSGLLKKVFKKS